MTDTTKTLIHDLARRARVAQPILARAEDEAVSKAVRTLATLLRAGAQNLIAINAKDVNAARKEGISEALIDRLTLTQERIEAMADGAEIVANLPDPIGRVLWENVRPNGLVIQRVSVPIGVLGMIYESRPNVSVDAAALALKSRNALILRGGGEALTTCLALHDLIKQAMEGANLPTDAIAMVPIRDRGAVDAMLEAAGMIDLLIPRGGRGLIERVVTLARMPVLSHLDGVCHVYIDASADPEMAKAIVLNAKMQRTGVCNAAEALLLDRALGRGSAHAILETLHAAGCVLVGDEEARALHEAVGPATPQDWGKEYLCAKMAVAVVDGVGGAIAHIARYGSSHTEAIVAQDKGAAQRFLTEVDAGSVLHNASTRFADGFEYGLGAEIGIATGKLHARGPVGAEQLTTYKYIVHGTGQIRT